MFHPLSTWNREMKKPDFKIITLKFIAADLLEHSSEYRLLLKSPLMFGVHCQTLVYGHQKWTPADMT